MKVLFFIAVWVNIVFFLWESNFANIDTVYDGDVNAVKQILLQSELLESNKKNTIVKNIENNVLETKPSVNDIKEKKNNKLNNKIKNEKNLEVSAEVTKIIPKNKAENSKTKTKKTAIKKDKKPSDKVATLLPEHCYHIGPFKNPGVFDEWRDQNKIDSASVVLLKKNEQTITQYMVYYPGSGDNNESKENMTKLKELGIVDAWLFKKGDFKGGISLGLYDREEPAKLRIKEVGLLFIDSEIKVIKKTKSALYAKVSKIKNNVKQTVNLSSKQAVIDCDTKY